MIYRFCTWQLSSLNGGSMQMDLGLSESCTVFFTWFLTLLLSKNKTKQNKNSL